uniref:Down syndrome cell adhesion molecule-like protein 1 n=1 Tax=Rhipicephalus zambeziensis TaxID=60191 RepID=A0A224YX47_9ACAR
MQRAHDPAPSNTERVSSPYDCYGEPTHSSAKCRLGFRQQTEAAAAATVTTSPSSSFFSHVLQAATMRLARSPTAAKETLPRPARVRRATACSVKTPSFPHLIGTALFFFSRCTHTRRTHSRVPTRRFQHAPLVMRLVSIQLWCLLATVLTQRSDAEDVAPTIQQIIASTKVSAGEKATAACLLKRGSEPLTFQWLRSNVDASLLPNVRVVRFEDTLLLVVDPASAESSGNYTCAASNALGSDVQTVHIEVSVPPAWKKVPGDTEVREGYNRSFQCIAFGSPKPNVTWSKQKESRDGWMTMRADSRISFEGSTMTIMDIQLSDTGTYSCVASNGVGPGITATFQLRINVPARFEEKSTVVTARRTEVTRMKCQATGDQPLSIAWSKGSVKLDKRTSARYEVFETLTPDGLISELVIRDTDRSDGALYTCHTQNKYGKDDRKVKLIVQEVPGPPQDVRLKDVWSRSASVSWSPSYSGNSPISKYIVQYWRDHGTAHRLHELEVIGSLTYTMVRELLPGTAYVLNLVAENAIGRGEPSRTVVFHTGEEEPEAAPVDILVEMKGPSTVYISWKAPPREHWNGHLLGYYIGYRPRDTESQFSYRRVEASPTNASHEYLLGGLQRGTEYTLVLKAYNSAGSGPASQEKTVRTMDGDVPEAPRLFVTGVTADTMTLRWVIRSSSDVTGFNIHYRQEGGTWLELPIVNTANNTYTLTNLHPGYVYQVYVTASNVLGRGDPSAILLIRTESSASGHESSAIENKQADDEVPIYMDMAIMIPAGAILLAVLVILFSTCICIRKMKSTPRPVPEIMRYDPATLNTGTMMSQRYVEMEKMSEQDVPFATPYEGGTMRNGTELRGTLKERQEMKTYVPKNPMKDRPLPHPEHSPLRMDETYYDSAQ